MAKTLLDLAERFDKLGQNVNKAASDLASSVALGLVEELADVTPVDTSKAISNWQIGLGIPVSSEREAYYFGSKGSTELISEDATVINARRVLKAKKPGQIIYVSNLAKYITDLDGGSSMQEPAGFVHRACVHARCSQTLKAGAEAWPMKELILKSLTK